MLHCIPNLLDAEALATIRAALARADFVDGRATAGFWARTVKRNEQLDRKTEGREALDRMVIEALDASVDFQRAAFPKTINRPLFSRYREGMAYGPHVDDALMGKGARRMRSDLSVTIFLSPPDDYDGGALEIQSPYGAQTIKLPAGAAVVYPSQTLHRVAPVTRGERLAVVTWVQSRVRDASRRELLHDLDRIRRHLHRAAPEAEECALAFKSYANLLRLWAET